MLRSRGEQASELSLLTTPFRLQISQDIQCTCRFINTKFELCLPSSIRVISQSRTMPNTSPFFPLLCPLQACPHCHPASSMRSMTSASPLPPWYPNNIQHSSGLAAFLDSSSPERGLTEMREPQEKEEKKIVSYNNIFSMRVLAAWLFSLLDVVVWFKVGPSLKFWNPRTYRCFCNATEVAWGNKGGGGRWQAVVVLSFWFVFPSCLS